MKAFQPSPEMADSLAVPSRQWVIDLAAPAVHSIVRRRLYLRNLCSTDMYLSSSLPTLPPGVTNIATLDEIAEQLEREPLENLRRRAGFTGGSFLSVVLGEFVEARRDEGIPLTEALRLVEGLTSPAMLTARSLARLQNKRIRKRIRTPQEVTAVGIAGLPVILDHWRKLKERLLQPNEREYRLLEEYETIRTALTEIAAQERALRFTLRDIVGASGKLSLGTWSCELSKGEWTRIWRRPRVLEDNPSEWAEELLMAKHRKSARYIKRRLQDQRTERRIENSWASYGRWLQEHPDRLHELEILLGGLPIRAPSEVAPR
jgi:hypothetical protein